MKMKTVSSRIFLLLQTFAFLLLLALGQPAFAGQTWDGGGTGGNWTTGANWNPDGTATSGSTSDIFFAGSVGLSSTNDYAGYTPWRNILFNSGAGAFTITSIAGANWDLYGKIENNSTNLQTISIDAIALHTSNNEFDPTAGDLTINAKDIYTNGVTLKIWGTKTLTINNTGGAGISQTGMVSTGTNFSGSVILNGSNSYSGGTAIDSGAITGNNNASFGTGTIFIGNGGSAFGNVSGTMGIGTSGLTITNTITTNKADNGGSAGTGTRTISATYASGTSTLQTGTTSINGGLAVNVTNAAAALAMNGVIQDGSDTGVVLRTLTKSGAGTLTLNGANTYTGATTVNAGTLVFGNTTQTSGTLGIASGAVLELKSANAFSSASAVTLSGSGTVRINGATSFGTAADVIALGSGALIDVQANAFNGGASSNKVYTNNLADLNVASGASFGTSNVAVRMDALSGSGTIDASSGFTGGSFTFGVDNGSGTFGGALITSAANKFNYTKLGTGTQTLSGSSNYTSTMNVNAGVLALSGSGNLGAATAGLAMGGGQLDLGGLSPSAIGAVSVTAAAASGDTIKNGSVSGTSYAVSNTTGTATISANLLANGGAGLTKSGAGTLTLSGSNTYTGGTTITGGTLALSGSGTLGATSGALTFSGSSTTLNIGSTTQTVASVTVGGTSNNYSSAITGAGGTLNDSGTLIVQGSSTNGSTYASNPTTTINSNVSVTGDTLVGRANFTISSGTFTTNRITSNAAGSTDWANVTISGGTVTATNGIDGFYGTTGSNGTAATFNLNLNGGTLFTPYIKVADREASGNAWLTFNGGTVKATQTTGTFITLYGGNQNAYISNGGAIVDTNGFNIGIGVTLKDTSGQTGTLTKQGTGTLTLSNSNTYTGITTINGGVLSANTIADTVGSSIGLSASVGAITFGASNGTLNFTGASGTTTRAILFTGQGTFDIAGGSTLTLGRTGTFAASTTIGAWTGNGGIVKTGSGTLTVRNNSTARGGGFVVSGSTGGTFTMQAGALNISPEGSAGNAHAVIGDGSGNPGVFNQTGGSVNFAPLNASTSNYFYVGLASSGTLSVTSGTFTADSTQSGGIQVARGAAGTLSIGGGAGAALVDTPLVNFGISTPGTGTLNLYTNGTLLTNQVSVASGTNTANFDGGTLKAKSSNTTFMSGLTTAAITSNGLTVDTNTFDITIGQALSGAGGLTKTNAGNLTLSGSNTYNGATTVNSGTLVIFGSPTGNSAPTVNNGGTLQLDYTTNNTSKINDSAVLTFNGGTVDLKGGTHTETVLSGTLTATSASKVTSSTGTSVLQMNTITRGAGSAIDFGASNIANTDTLNTNGILGTWATVSGSDYAMNSGATTAGGATVFGSGTADGFIRAYSNYTDVQRLTPGTIADGSTTNVRIIEGTGSAGSITLGSGTTTINSLNQSASGGTSAATITLSGKVLQTNGMLLGATSGNLTIGSVANEGTLRTATSGGELVLSNFNTSSKLLVNSTITDNTTGSALIKSGPGTVTLGGTTTYSGATRIASGTLEITGRLSSTGTPGQYNGSIVVAPGATLLFNSSLTMNPHNNVNGGGALIKDGSGSLTLDNPNTSTISGGILIRNGALSGWTLNSLGTSSIMMGGSGSTGATLTLGGVTFTNAITINAPDSGAIIVGNAFTTGSAAIFNGAVTLNGNVTFQSASGGIAAGLTIGGSVTGTGNLTLNNQNSGASATGGIILSNSNINPIGSITAQGPGTTTTTISGNIGSNVTGVTQNSATAKLVLSGSNSYSGGTTITTGTLQLGNANALGATTGSLAVNGGTVDLFGNSVTVGLLTGSSGGLITSSSNASIVLTASSALSGTYAGVIAQTSGTLGLTKSGAGTLNLTGSNSYSGGTTLSAGTLNFGNVDALGSGTLTLGTATLQAGTPGTVDNNVVLGTGSNGTIDSNSNNVTLSGTLTGAGTLTKIGAGTLTLSGSNTYTGATTVSAGTLGISGASALSGSTAKLSVTGATLDLSVDGTANNYNLLASGSTLALGSATVRFDVGGAGVNDLLTVTGTAAITGTNFISINAIAPTSGTYTLISAANGLTASGTNIFKLGSGAMAAGQTYALLNSATTEQLTSLASSGSFYWIGSSGTNWGSLTNGTSNWTSDLAGTAIIVGTPGAASDVIFSSTNAATTNRNTTLGANYSVNTLTISDTNGVTINSGNTLTALATSGSAFNITAAAGTTTINANLSGGVAGLTKSGAGTLNLTGSNSYSGGTTLSAGTLNFGNVDALGSGTLTLGNATLQAGTAGTVDNAVVLNPSVTGTFDTASFSSTLSGIVSGSGALAKIGAGTLTLSGTNTYAGATSVNAGTLKLGNAGALGNGTNNTSGVTVNGTAIFDFGGISPTANVALNLNSTNNTTDGGSLVNIGGSAVTFGGAVNLQAATVRVGSANTGGNNITLTGAITGNGKNVIKDSPNNLTLQNSGTVTLGTLQVFRGTLQLNSGTTLNPSGNFTLGGGTSVGTALTLNGGNLTVASGQTATFGSGGGSASSTLTLTSGTLTVPKLTKGTQTYSITFNGGTLKANAASTTFLDTGIGGTAKIQNGGAFIDDGGFAITIGQSLIEDAGSPGGGLTKTGTGTLTLSSSNSYTGGTTLSAGTLNFGNVNALGSGTLTFMGNSAVQSGTSGTVANAVVISPSVTGTFDTVALSSTLSGIVSGSGALTKIGAGTLTLSGSNSYGGGTTLSVGILQATNNAGTANSLLILGTGNVALNSGTLQLRANALSGTSTIVTGNGTTGNNVTVGGDTTVDVNRASGSNINNTFHFNNLTIGANTLNVTGANSYGLKFAGTTTINGNVVFNPTTAPLTLGGTVSGGSYTLTKNGAGTLTMGTTTIGAVIENGGYITMGAGSSTGAITISGGTGITFGDGATSTTGNITVNSTSNIYAGAGTSTTVTAGDLTVNTGYTLSLGDNAALVLNVNALSGTGNIDTNNGGGGIRTFNVGNSNATSEFSGVLTEASNRGLTLNKVGSGTLTLSGASSNVQVGGGQFFITTVQAGTLILNKTAAIALPGNVTVSSGTLQLAGSGGNQIADAASVTLSGGAFDLGTMSETVGAVSITAMAGSGDTIKNGNLTGSSYAASNTTGNAIVSANLLGSGITLAKSGAGTLTLSSSNSYTGGTTLSAGTLNFGNVNALGSGTLTLGTATLQSGTAGTVANNIVLGTGSNGTIDTNSNNVTLSGTLTGSGTLTKISAGTLTLSSSNSYSGGTKLSAGTLNYGNVDALGSGTLTLGTATLQAGTTGTVDNNIVLGTGSNGTIDTQANAVTLSGTLSGSGTMTKIGAGTLTLSSSNSYSGGTAINSGTLQVNAGGTLGATTSSLVMGTGSAGTIGTVGNLTVNNDVTVGAFSVASNTSDTTTPANIGLLYIASGNTLTVSSMTVGVPASGAGSTNTALATGAANTGGTLTVNGNFATASGAAGTTKVDLNLSGLSNFNVTSTGAGYFRAGYVGLATGTMTLANANTINVGTFSVGESNGAANSNVAYTLNLGAGTTAIQAPTIIIGKEKHVGVVTFADANGSVTITGANGSGTANITIGNFSVGTPNNTNTSSLLLAGHTATVSAGAVVVGQMTGTPVGTVAPKASLTFDTGNFTATSITLAQNNGTGTDSGNISSTVTIGGTSANLVATGSLSVSGNIYLASNTNSTAGATGTATGILTINGGTVSVNTGASPTGGILDNSTSTTGTSATTLTLAGGTLDLNGGVIGGDGSSGNRKISTLSFQSGTLQNVKEINNGTTALTKTGTGTLILDGSNSYTGGTTITSGTVQLASASALGSGTASLAVNAGTLDLNGNNVTVGLLTGSSGGLITTSSNASIVLTASSALSGTYAGGIANTSGTLGLTKAGAGTLTLSGSNSYSGGTALSAGALKFGNVNALGSGTLTFAGSSTLQSGTSGTVANNVVIGPSVTGTFDTAALSSTFSGIVSGSGALAKIGAGTLTLTGSNSYSGATTVQGGGKLTISGSGSISPTTGATLTVGASSTSGTFQYDSSATSKFGSITVGNGTTSPGTLNQTAGTINATSLSLNNGYSGNGPGTVALSGGTMTINGATIISNQTSGDNVLSTFTISGASTIFNASGELRLTGAPATGRNADGKFIQTDGTVNVAGANGLVLVQGISGNTAIRRGEYDLNGGTLNVNTITSTSTAAADAVAIFNFNGGTLKPTASSTTFWASNAQTTANVLNGGAKIDTNGFDITIAQSLLSGTAADGGLTKTGIGTLTLSGSNSYRGATAVSNGTLTIDTTGVIGGGASGTAITVNGGTLTDNSTVATTGGITGNSSLTVTSGTANLNTANNFSGTTSVTDTLLLANADSVKNSAVTLKNGATLQLRNNSPTSFNANGVVTLSGATANPTVTFDVNNNGSNTGNTLTLANGISYTAPSITAGTYTTTINVTGGNDYTLAVPSVAFTNGNSYGSGGTRNFVLDINPTSANVSLGNVTLTGGGTRVAVSLTLDGTSVGNVITGAISMPTGRPLTKSGSGTWTLSGTNTYDGTTSITAGTLRVGADNTLPYGSGKGNVSLAGTLDLNGYQLNVNGLSGAGTVDALAGTTSSLTVGNNGQTSSFTGVIQNTAGTLAVTKTGTGTLTLSNAANSYSGKNIVQNGTLSFSAGNASATANQVLGTNTDLDLGVSGTSSGTLLYTGGTDTLAKNINALGNGSDTVQNSGGLLTLSGTLTNDGTTLTLKGGANGINVTGVIAGASGSSDLVIDGGLVILSNTSNSYNGSTIVQSGGTASVAGDYFGLVPGSPTAGNIVLNSGTLAATDSFTLDGNRGLAVGPGSGSGGGTVQVDSTKTVTYGGIIANNGAGTGSLTKAGDGTLTLTGSNSYTGGTTITGGTLVVGDDHALGTGLMTLDGGNLASSGPARLIANPVVVTSTIGGITGDNDLTFTGGASGGGTLVVKANATAKIDGADDSFAPAAIQVNTGGTLVLSGSNKVGNGTEINLAGGTFNVNEKTDTVGALTLSANSTIDFSNSATASTLSFTTGTNNGSYLLSIYNWAGGPSGTTHLNFTPGLTSGFLNNVHFYSGADSGGGWSQGALQLDGGELVPVPEPATIIGAFAFLGLIVLRERRRIVSLWKKTAASQGKA